jgi:pyrroline-5-carboxylate reductase
MQTAFSETRPLVLVGCGNMGRAMALGWLRAGLGGDSLWVIDPGADKACLPGVEAARFVDGADQIPSDLTARAVVLAVKPQMMDDVLPAITPLVGKETVVLSVAAGVTLATLARGTDERASYVRVMPNTPCAIGAGISGLMGDAGISAEDKALADRLMQAVGETVWVDGEALMDSVTAVSGSGPAYVFYMVECMAAAGVRAGLPEEAAMKLARQTVVGAARLLDAESDVPADELRRRVTSPGGTTAAALAQLMEDKTGLGNLMTRAVAAARKRGEELGQGS